MTTSIMLTTVSAMGICITLISWRGGRWPALNWENVRIADPASDLGRLLCRYYRPSDWTMAEDLWRASMHLPTNESSGIWLTVYSLSFLLSREPLRSYERAGLLLKSYLLRAQADKRRLAHQPKVFLSYEIIRHKPWAQDKLDAHPQYVPQQAETLRGQWQTRFARNSLFISKWVPVRAALS